MISQFKNPKNRDYFILICSLALLIVLYFLFVGSSDFFDDKESGQNFFSNFTGNETITDKIMSNPNEYVNRQFLSMQSEEEKNMTLNDLYRSINDRCLDGKLDDDCNTPFLGLSLKMLRLMDVDIKNNPYYEKIKLAYLDLKNTHLDGNFKRRELHDFTLFFVNEMCLIDFKNMNSDEEKYFWVSVVSNVNDKKIWDDTHVQVRFIWECYGAESSTEFSEKSGIPPEDIENNICDMIPSFDDINKEDICSINDYIQIKIFCESPVSKEDKVFISSKLSENHDTYYQKTCKHGLTYWYDML